MPRPTVGHERATGPTKNRNVKVQPELWAKATRKAASEGKSMSQAVRDLLEAYVADEQEPAPLSESA